ncbi:hypothetical protein Tco_1373400, partial [Tanacetum coccineum]
MLLNLRFSLHLRRKILLRTQSVATAVIHAIGSETVPDIYLSCYRKRIYLRELVLQEIKGSRKLKPGALSLYMGNGQRAAVEAIESYDLCFPSGLF